MGKQNEAIALKTVSPITQTLNKDLGDDSPGPHQAIFKRNDKISPHTLYTNINSLFVIAKK